MLCERDIALVEAAWAALAGAEHGGVHRTAATAYDSADAMVTAMDVEHPAGGACAELVLAGAAAATAVPPLTTMVAVRDQGPVAPCVSCCRILVDLYPELRIIVPCLVRIGTALGPGVGLQATAVHRVLSMQERRDPLGPQ